MDWLQVAALALSILTFAATQVATARRDRRQRTVSAMQVTAEHFVNALTASMSRIAALEGAMTAGDGEAIARRADELRPVADALAASRMAVVLAFGYSHPHEDLGAGRITASTWADYAKELVLEVADAAGDGRESILGAVRLWREKYGQIPGIADGGPHRERDATKALADMRSGFVAATWESLRDGAPGRPPAGHAVPDAGA